MYGWTNPHPMKYGAEKNSRLEEIVNTLLENQGTALSKDYESYNFVLAHAAGRLLNDLFAANEALSHITDPYKMSVEYVERFEKIFNLYHNPEDSLNMRRARIALHIFFFGKSPNFTTINDYLTQALPDIYIGIVNTMATEATLYVPGGGSVPGGGPTFLDANTMNDSPHFQIVPTLVFDGITIDLDSAIAKINELIPIYSSHIASANIITLGAHLTADNVNTPLPPVATNLANAIVIANNLRNKFNAHIISGIYHNVPDSEMIIAPVAIDLPSLQDLLLDMATKMSNHYNKFSPPHWVGSTCFMAIQFAKPDGMPDHVFYDLVGQIQILDSIMPVWITFDWFQDGPMGSGFYLDQDYNLDNQRL